MLIIGVVSLMTIEENSSLELETKLLSPEILKIFKQQTIDENQPGNMKFCSKESLVGRSQLDYYFTKELGSHQ